MVDDSPDDAIDFHLPELLDEHFLRNGRDRPLKFREPKRLPPEQVKQDDELPATFKEFQRRFDTFRCRRTGVAVRLTFG